MATIKITTKEKTLVPDVFGNMDLPEKERMAFVFLKVNSLFLYNKASEVKEGGGLRINQPLYIKSTLKEIKNPMSISIDGKPERPITIDDVLNYSEFSDLSIKCWSATYELNRSKEDEESDAKKS